MEHSAFRRLDGAIPLAVRLIIPWMVGDEVTRRKFSQLFPGKLESPDVVSYFMNGLLAPGQIRCQTCHREGGLTRILFDTFPRGNRTLQNPPPAGTVI